MCKRRGRGLDLLVTIILFGIAALAGLCAGVKEANGTEVCRRRDYQSERSIARVVGGLGLGVVFGEGKGLEQNALRLVSRPVFYLDGEESNMWRVLLRMGLYILDLKHDGEVQYVYVLEYEGLRLNRWTIIRDGYVHAITIIPEPMARMSWARLDTYAYESGSGTLIRNKLTISTPYGNRCCLVRRIVYREAVPPMDNALWKIENEAVELFEDGQTSPIVRAFASWYLSRRGRR